MQTALLGRALVRHPQMAVAKSNGADMGTARQLQSSVHETVEIDAVDYGVVDKEQVVTRCGQQGNRIVGSIQQGGHAAGVLADREWPGLNTIQFTVVGARIQCFTMAHQADNGFAGAQTDAAFQLRIGFIRHQHLVTAGDGDTSGCQCQVVGRDTTEHHRFFGVTDSTAGGIHPHHQILVLLQYVQMILIQLHFVGGYAVGLRGVGFNLPLAIGGGRQQRAIVAGCRCETTGLQCNVGGQPFGVGRAIDLFECG